MSELPADWQSALRRRQALLTDERCLAGRRCTRDEARA